MQAKTAVWDVEVLTGRIGIEDRAIEGVDLDGIRQGVEGGQTRDAGVAGGGGDIDEAAARVDARPAAHAEARAGGDCDIDIVVHRAGLVGQQTGEQHGTGRAEIDLRVSRPVEIAPRDTGVSQVARRGYSSGGIVADPQSREGEIARRVVGDIATHRVFEADDGGIHGDIADARGRAQHYAARQRLQIGPRIAIVHQLGVDGSQGDGGLGGTGGGDIGRYDVVVGGCGECAGPHMETAAAVEGDIASGGQYHVEPLAAQRAVEDGGVSLHADIAVGNQGQGAVGGEAVDIQVGVVTDVPHVGRSGRGVDAHVARV